jgi:nicotinate-nucleotide adenylyltransferase
MMDLAHCHKLLVFGGSFDPPHLAHVKLPAMVMQAIDADLLAYIPTAQQPLKIDQQVTNAQHRLAMLQLAVEDQPNTIILTDELDRGSTSFTVDTLEQLRIQLNESATMRLLIGGDQLQLFDQWKNSERIIELAEPVVMVRPPQSRSSLLKSLPKGYNSAQWAMRLVDVPAMAISSTIVRQLVSQAQPIDELVAPAVKAYIREHALYQGKMPRTL